MQGSLWALIYCDPKSAKLYADADSWHILLVGLLAGDRLRMGAQMTTGANMVVAVVK